MITQIVVFVVVVAVAIAVFSYRHRSEKGIESGISSFRRELDALAPRHPQNTGRTPSTDRHAGGDVDDVPASAPVTDAETAREQGPAAETEPGPGDDEVRAAGGDEDRAAGDDADDEDGGADESAARDDDGP